MRRSPEESCLRGKDVSRFNGDMPGQYRTFRERFCERFTCQPTAYETTALWELLDPQPRLFGRVLAWLKPDLLETDRRILRRVSHLDTVPDVLLAVQNIEKEYEARSDFGIVRKMLNLKVSRDKVLRLTAQLWQPEATQPI